MRRSMEYVRWELDNWWMGRHGRDMSFFTETKKVASYMWQSWKCGAMVVLILALLPILFPLVLFFSFVGFISAVPLLCGAAAYYLIFRRFPLPLSITEVFNPSNRSFEILISGSPPGEDRRLESAPFVVQELENREPESVSMTSTIGQEGTEEGGRVSDAKAILLLGCDLLVNERDEAGNREHHRRFKLNLPSEGNQRKSESGAGSSSSVICHSDAVLQVRGPIFLLPSAKLKSQYEHRKDEGTWHLDGTEDDFIAEALEREVADVLSNELSKSNCRKAPADGMVAFEKEAGVVEVVTSVETNYPGQGRGPAEFLLSKSFPPGEELQSKGEPAAGVTSPLSEKTKSSAMVPAMDAPVCGLLEEGCSVGSVCGTACTPLHITEADRICDGGTCSMVEGCGEYPTTESVFIQHAVTVAPAAEPSETSGHLRGHDTDGKNRPAENRTLTGNLEVVTDPSVNSTSVSFSHSEDTAHAGSESISHAVPARYWRDEVEDTVLSTAIANGMACMENRSSGASGDMVSLTSWNIEPEKMTMNGQDVMSLLECSGEGEIFSAWQTPNSEQYKEKLVEGENGRTDSSIRFATSLFSLQRRLSFNNVLEDDEMASLGFSLPREKLNDFTPDCKKQSVSTSFSSDYTWPSESSGGGFEFLSTEEAAYEDSCVDTDSSTAKCEEESGLEPDVVSDSTFSPTPDELTEDWETRRKIWEDQSTPGRLVPSSPYMRARSVEARSMCNPLFEFSTPSPPLKKLRTGDENHSYNSPAFHARFTKRHSASPEILRTPTCSSGATLSPRQLKIQECKSGLNAERLESSTTRHARSYSASFTESLEPYSGEFEGLLRYWRRRDKIAHSLSSSPRHSPTATSPAEAAHRIREEIDAIQMIIGQEIPPQYSLWKEVENLSQMIGMKLPYMGDMSDMSKARQGLDLLKIVVCSPRVVEL